MDAVLPHAEIENLSPHAPCSALEIFSYNIFKQPYGAREPTNHDGESPIFAGGLNGRHEGIIIRYSRTSGFAGIYSNARPLLAGDTVSCGEPPGANSGKFLFLNSKCSRPSNFQLTPSLLLLSIEAGEGKLDSASF